MHATDAVGDYREHVSGWGTRSVAYERQQEEEQRDQKEKEEQEEQKEKMREQKEQTKEERKEQKELQKEQIKKQRREQKDPDGDLVEDMDLMWEQSQSQLERKESPFLSSGISGSSWQASSCCCCCC